MYECLPTYKETNINSVLYSTYFTNEYKSLPHSFVSRLTSPVGTLSTDRFVSRPESRTDSIIVKNYILLCYSTV
jgi:hypothetical protein